jgi:antitoxin component YwqK of YwqJK toxin-antitoxin module|tara:strand:+ start:703 stop:1275 length:573 start_codon:yes stop_codon:yes gene_type:complete
MSFINGEFASKWLKVNHPENGLFRAYWTEDGNATLTNNGLPLRYEWYYKDGKKHGVSRGWVEDGDLKCEWNWKDGKQDGLQTKWWSYNTDRQKMEEGTWKDGEYFLLNVWDRNGKIIIKDGNGIWYEKPYRKRTYKNGKLDGLFTSWYKNGQKKKEGTYKVGKRTGLWTNWYENGEKWSEKLMDKGKKVK